MSETVKLIIEIPKDAYSACRASRTDNDKGILIFCVANAVANGTPLDSNSEKAEVQAYFDGQAYGWEEGRKALIEDIKAEIIKRENVKAVGSDNRCYFTMEEILRIIDTYMTESEY